MVAGHVGGQVSIGPAMGRENQQRSRAEDAGGHRALPPVALAARVLQLGSKGGAP